MNTLVRTPFDSVAALPRIVAEAPHRLLFLVGAANVLLAMGWWALYLVDVRWGLIGLPPAPQHAGWMHAILMLYQVLSPFVFGFLLTVFPRWMGLPALTRWHYLPVGMGLLGGQALTLVGLFGLSHLLHLGALFTLAGWCAGLVFLLRLLWDEDGVTWHARSCAFALLLGATGFACYVAFLHGATARLMHVAIEIGSYGFLLPMYVTVAHRMFPFFAANVVRGYVAWRPLGWLAAFWVGALVHLGMEMTHAYAWLWLPDVPLLLLGLWWLHRAGAWRGAPPLLRVLFAGFAWLPLSLLLHVGQSAWFLATGEFSLGRAPDHALFVGFFGSLLVAMVTRVTQGHSGRVLELGRVAGFAFVAIQIVAILRIAAELVPDAPAWQAAAALGWLLAFLPWVLRSAVIYLTPRADGQPG